MASSDQSDALEKAQDNISKRKEIHVAFSLHTSVNNPIWFHDIIINTLKRHLLLIKEPG